MMGWISILVVFCNCLLAHGAGGLNPKVDLDKVYATKVYTILYPSKRTIFTTITVTQYLLTSFEP